MGKTQQWIFQALYRIRERILFEWNGIDTDNESEFIRVVIVRCLAFSFRIGKSALFWLRVER